MASNKDQIVLGTPKEEGKNLKFIKEEPSCSSVEEEAGTSKSSLPRNAPKRPKNAVTATKRPKNVVTATKRTKNAVTAPKRTKNAVTATKRKQITQSLTKSFGKGENKTLPRNNKVVTAQKRTRITRSSLKKAGEKGENKSEVPPTGKSKDVDDKRPWKCPHCPRHYKLKKYLQAHKRSYNHQEQYRCEVCQISVFTTKQELDSHTLTHTGPKRYQCGICLCWFGSETTFKTHRFVHNDTEDFRCWKCGKHFSAATELLDHMVTHRRDERFECHICHQKFDANVSLKRHVIEHADLKEQLQHPCEYCTESFGRRHYLKSHMRTHKGVEPFKCPVCGEMQRHRSHVKECEEFRAKNPFKCADCPSTWYPTKIGLSRHRKRHHDDTVYNIIDVKMVDVLGYNLYE